VAIRETEGGSPFFDHSWIEIDGLPYDVSVAYPLVKLPGYDSAGVFAGLEVATGSPTPLTYGAGSGLGFDSPANAIAKLTLEEYLDGSIGHFPGHPNGLWDIARVVAAYSGHSTDVKAGRQHASTTRWSVRVASERPR
jgi:hypothetical protein